MSDHDATEEIAQVVRSISALMVAQRFVGLDFTDLKQILGRQKPDGAGRRSFVGQGEASGENRAERAAELAIAALRRNIAYRR